MARTKPKHRFFADDLSGASAVLAGAEAHHALHVLRLEPGDGVELFDGKGRSAAGTIARRSRGAVTVTIDATEGPLPRPVPCVHVLFAPPKGKRLDWLLEKAAELGVAAVRPIVCERSVVKVRFRPDVRSRWLGICASAVRQSGQSHLPEILPPVSFAEAVAGGPAGVGLIGHAGPDTQALATALPDGPAGCVELLVGPEGGWTEAELQAARAAGYRPARLGRTTLRVETAAVALAAAVVAICQGRG